MPFSLKKARGKDLYYVITKATGKKHSKEPLTIDKAKAQMRALYYALSKDMRGSGFFGDIWNSAKSAVSNAYNTIKTGATNLVSSVSNVLSNNAPRNNLNPNVRALLAKMGDIPIVQINVRRDPVSSGLTTALNVISLGKWDEVTNKYGYDKFFHLGLECVLDDAPRHTYITIEKNAVIEVRPSSPSNENTERIAVPLQTARNPPVTLNKLLNGAKAIMGKNFLYYDAFKCNCQDFVSGLLRGSGLGNQEIFEFVKQPINQVAEEIPSWTGKISRALTDLGGIYDTVRYGQGRSKPMSAFAKQLKECGVNPIDYLAIAKKNAHAEGLADNMLSFSTDEKHKLQIPNCDGKIIRFGAVGLNDYILYSMMNDPEKEQHRSSYRKRAMKIRGDWKSDPYSANSLAVSVLWR